LKFKCLDYIRVSSNEEIVSLGFVVPPFGEIVSPALAAASTNGEIVTPALAALPTGKFMPTAVPGLVDPVGDVVADQATVDLWLGLLATEAALGGAGSLPDASVGDALLPLPDALGDVVLSGVPLVPAVPEGGAVLLPPLAAVPASVEDKWEPAPMDVDNDNGDALAL
jgi:hypothetical protein